MSPCPCQRVKKTVLWAPTNVSTRDRDTYAIGWRWRRVRGTRRRWKAAKTVAAVKEVVLFRPLRLPLAPSRIDHRAALHIGHRHELLFLCSTAAGAAPLPTFPTENLYLSHYYLCMGHVSIKLILNVVVSSRPPVTHRDRERSVRAPPVPRRRVLARGEPPPLQHAPRQPTPGCIDRSWRRGCVCADGRVRRKQLMRWLERRRARPAGRGGGEGREVAPRGLRHGCLVACEERGGRRQRRLERAEARHNVVARRQLAWCAMG